MRFLRNNGLSLFFLAIFVAAIVGQSVAGWFDQNEMLAMHAQAAMPYVQYVTSSDFIVDVAENWQSEFLQFFLFILATVWFIQRGSPESKKPGDEGIGSDKKEKVGRYAEPDSPSWAKATGWRQTVYSNSLLITMGAIFLLSWLAQAIAGHTVFNAEQAEHGQDLLTLGEYALSADFWNRTLQNWQSEFLAVGSMVTLSIVLRQRGSSESKPVGTPHHETAVSAE